MTYRSPDTVSWAQRAAEQIVSIARRAIAERGRFTVALCGSDTPGPVYQLLAAPTFARELDWSRVDIFWGDERRVPPDDPDSNYRMAKQALLDLLSLPFPNIHRMHGEDDPELAAHAYGQTLQSVFGGDPANGSPPTGFDLVLLGIGENGHAALFPGLMAVRERQRWVVAEQVPAWRLTLTPVLLNAAANVVFLVCGEAKAEVLQRVIEGPTQPDMLPAQAIHPIEGRLTWLTDAAAASRLQKS